MPQRVVIHVGCPKTGTTAIQHQLLMNPIALAAQGFFYPSETPHQHFLATVDVLDLHWGPEIKEESVGAWDRLVDQIHAHPGNAIISHELLARASSDRIADIVKSLGDVDVSVVITARDLGRLIPAEYQEHLKHRAIMTYRTFLERLHDLTVDDVAGRHARLTWEVQDVPAIAERWAGVLGSERITVVTVPSGTAPRSLLMRRFCEAAGIDGTELREVQEVSENPSLGVHQIELLRRLNERYNDELDDRAYGGFVRNRLVRSQEVDGARKVSLRLPADEYPWVRSISEERVKAITAAGYRVVGDLDELMPIEPQGEPLMPETLDDQQMFDTALLALVSGIQDFEELIAAWPEPRRRLVRQGVQRGKERIVRFASTRSWGQRALKAWEARH